jgi:hypothetical protein
MLTRAGTFSSRLRPRWHPPECRPTTDECALVASCIFTARHISHPAANPCSMPISVSVLIQIERLL